MSGTKRTMVCCICMQRIDATIVQAKTHGWTVWVGGAFCKRHTDADVEPMRAEIDRVKLEHADALVMANAQREGIERRAEAMEVALRKIAILPTTTIVDNSRHGQGYLAGLKSAAWIAGETWKHWAPSPQADDGCDECEELRVVGPDHRNVGGTPWSHHEKCPKYGDER